MFGMNVKYINPDIEVSEWEKHLSELHGLQCDGGFVVSPVKIGKAKMEEVSLQLKKAKAEK